MTSRRKKLNTALVAVSIVLLTAYVAYFKGWNDGYSSCEKDTPTQTEVQVKHELRVPKPKDFWITDTCLNIVKWNDGSGVIRYIKGCER